MLQKKIISSEISKCILQSTPLPSFLPVPYLILCLNRKFVNFNFKWIFENLNFWFSDHSDIGVRTPHHCCQKINAHFWIMFNFWWLAKQPKQQKSTEMWKKGTLSHQKMKCSFLDYVQLLMISQVIRSMKVNQNVKKGPLSHQKMKCSILNYIQLLMISQAILAKVDQNAKKGPLSHQKMKCSFLDYIQLLMIGWAIWATKVDKNAPPKCLRMTWNGQFHLICNFTNLFPPKWLRIAWNSQFHPIHSFSNLFPLRWLRMTQNGQFCIAKKKKKLYDKRISMKDYTSTWTAVP